MKYLSLFSGIGGFELGIQQAYESNLKHSPISEESESEERTQGRVGASDKHGILLHPRDRTAPLCVGFSEIDKYAIQIYQKHFPYEQCKECSNRELLQRQTSEDIHRGVTDATLGQTGIINCECNHKNYGDITKIKEDELPDFDLLVGGFPCQSFSIAGKRKGFADTRGTLFFEIARICKAKQPRLLLLENVKGLLSHDNGNTFRTIISTLDELGYDLQWQVLNSKNFGVPQNRERVFIVGHLRGTSRPQVFPFRESGGHTEKPDAKNSSISPLQTTPPITTQGGMNVRGLFVSESEFGVRRLTPTECERLQGFPDNWTEGISDTQRYKCCGNAVTVNVIQAIMERLCLPL